MTILTTSFEHCRKQCRVTNFRMRAVGKLFNALGVNDFFILCYSSCHVSKDNRSWFNYNRRNFPAWWMSRHQTMLCVLTKLSVDWSRHFSLFHIWKNGVLIFLKIKNQNFWAASLHLQHTRGGNNNKYRTIFKFNAQFYEGIYTQGDMTPCRFTSHIAPI